MQYHIATFGCQMNEYDSLLIAKMMEQEGCTATEDPANADFLIFNTCSVREKAEETAIARISKMKCYKEANPNVRIVVVGCMAKHLGEALMKKRHIIDFVIGPDQYNKIPEILFKRPIIPTKGNRKYRVFTEFDNEETYLGQTAKLLSPFSTHIAIQRGCNKRCSYCIVPFVRGPEKYREVSDIIHEVKEAADRGVSEIMLLGQTVNAYKSDKDTFATLLNKVSDISGIQRIRFTSPHPRHYTQDLIDVLLGNPKVCQSAHMPLQSGSDAMLKKMRRQHTVDEYLRTIEKLRGANPFYGLSTDIISGFVGETEADFECTLNMVREIQFDSAFMFIYSPREGTESANEPETLSEEQKWERQARLVEIQNEITLQRNKLMLGRNEEILVEHSSSKNPEEWVGKTNNFKKVVFKPVGEIHPGDYLICNIDDIRGWTLRGTPIAQ